MSEEASLLPSPTNWPDGWHPVDPQTAAGLADELKRELHPSHRLYGFPVSAVARRFDCDDVLFLAKLSAPALAQVHLTWRGGVEQNGTWPFTTVYQRFEDWAADQSPAPE